MANLWQKGQYPVLPVIINITANINNNHILIVCKAYKTNTIYMPINDLNSTSAFVKFSFFFFLSNIWQKGQYFTLAVIIKMVINIHNNHILAVSCKYNDITSVIPIIILNILTH